VEHADLLRCSILDPGVCSTCVKICQALIFVFRLVAFVLRFLLISSCGVVSGLDFFRFLFHLSRPKSEFGIDFSSCCVDCYREKPVVFLTYRIKKLEFSRF
jgi:hypothetical protein